jgi:hypothetical protein
MGFGISAAWKHVSDITIRTISAAWKHVSDIIIRTLLLSYHLIFTINKTLQMWTLRPEPAMLLHLKKNWIV